MAHSLQHYSSVSQAPNLIFSIRCIVYPNCSQTYLFQVLLFHFKSKIVGGWKKKKWMLNRKSVQNDCKWCTQVVDITTKALDRDSIQFWIKFWATYISIVLIHTHPCTALPSWIAKCECGLRGGWRETWKSSARPRVTFRIWKWSCQSVALKLKGHVAKFDAVVRFSLR